MKNITKKIPIIALMTTMLIAISIPMFANTVSADTFQIWDVTGEYLVDVESEGEYYPEKLILTQVGSSITGGSINTVPPSPNSLFIMDDGSVDGDVIHFFGYYNLNTDFRIHFSGIIAPDGSMSGDWADITGHQDFRTGDWETTGGLVSPIFQILDLPDGVTATIEIIDVGDLPDCISALPAGLITMAPYVDVEITGDLEGPVTVAYYYDDSGLTIEQEMKLRLFMACHCVDFNEDGTINGQDLSILKKGIKKGAIEIETDNYGFLSFDLNGDGAYDKLDENIVKDHMTKGLIVNQGENDLPHARLPWLGITTSVDIENNIIYGETDHFSIFRCR